MALRAVGVGRGDEVICPNLTFVAVANAIKYCGAKPVFCEVNRRTWVSESEQIFEKETNKTKAVIVVHSYGVPADFRDVVSASYGKKYYVIEDCSEAIGAKLHDQKVGTIGDIGTFSFFGNKTITTGEGGMLCTNIGYVRERAESMRNNCHVMDYLHDGLGYNYRMSNITAAMGRAQMTRLDSLIAKKNEISMIYDAFLDDRFEKNGIDEDYGKTGACWLYTVLVSDRDEFREYMAEHGIETRAGFFPLNRMFHFPKQGRFKTSEFLSKHLVSFPSYTSLTHKDILKICEVANGARFLSKL